MDEILREALPLILIVALLTATPVYCFYIWLMSRN